MATTQGTWAAIVAAALAVAPGAPAQQPAQPGAKPAEAAQPAAAAQPAEAAKPAPPAPKLGEFLNLKVLPHVTAPEMFNIMHVIRASLGVNCDYCHVSLYDRFELDTKPAKQTARAMLEMVRKINQDNFAGETVVTCETCHHGHITPPRAPSVDFGLKHVSPGEPLGGPSQIAVADLPSATEVLDRYIQALGGRAALEAVRSRVARGTMLHHGPVHLDTPEGHADTPPKEDPIEIVQRLPDKVFIVYGPPDEQVVQSYDSQSSWLKTPTRGLRNLAPADAAPIVARNDLRKDLKLRERADAARVLRRETIDGHETYVVEMTSPEGYPAHLFFDVKSGLLRRQIAYHQTLVGPTPEQTDFDDYRAVDGVKVPFLVKVAPLDSLHYGMTRKLTEVRDNVE